MAGREYLFRLARLSYLGFLECHDPADLQFSGIAGSLGYFQSSISSFRASIYFRCREPSETDLATDAQARRFRSTPPSFDPRAKLPFKHNSNRLQRENLSF